MASICSSILPELVTYMDSNLICASANNISMMKLFANVVQYPTKLAYMKLFLAIQLSVLLVVLVDEDDSACMHVAHTCT
jgi:hypothetical protein